MLPILSTKNGINRRARDSELSGQLAFSISQTEQASNFQHIFHFQFCAINTLSIWAVVPALIDAISDIIRCRADKKVCWITAGWIIAFMTAIKAFRNRTIGEFPGEPVRRLMSPANGDYSMTEFPTATSPRPAVFWAANTDPAPKSLFNRFWIIGRFRAGKPSLLEIFARRLSLQCSILLLHIRLFLAHGCFYSSWASLFTPWPSEMKGQHGLL